jgi:uncharacterized RDD family membrane protein YckC
VDAGPAASAPDIRYARLSRRLQAAVVDAAVYLTMPAAAALVALAVADGRPHRPLAWALGVAAFLYEPVLVSWRGATIGHASKGVRVLASDTGRPPGFPRALGRFVAKAATGLLTAPLVSLTPRHQALHDLLAGTVVEVRDGPHGSVRRDAYPPGIPGARPPLTAGRIVRRVTVTAAWSLLLAFVFAAVVDLLASDGCIQTRVCAGSEIALLAMAGQTWAVTQYALLWFGLAGRLPGARG